MIRIGKFILILIAIFTILWHCDDNSSGPDKNEKNVPGRILWVSVPDSIIRPEQGFLNRALVTAAVEDSNGLDDVDSVYFYSKKPDGTLGFEGKPLVMVDNGKPFNINGNPFIEAGDEKAGDGIYSLTILIDHSAQLGRYYFTFYMRDKAGHLSEGVVDSIEVIE